GTAIAASGHWLVNDGWTLRVRGTLTNDTGSNGGAVGISTAAGLRFTSTTAPGTLRSMRASGNSFEWHDSAGTPRMQLTTAGELTCTGGVKPSSDSTAITFTGSGTYTFAESIAGNTCVARTTTITGTVATDVAVCSSDFGDSSLTLRCEPQNLGFVGVLVCNVGGGAIDLTGKVVRIRVLR
ncbi:MAG: hypothetical protein ACK4N5_11320, partial [Myxococcales bacterium]